MKNPWDASVEYSSDGVKDYIEHETGLSVRSLSRLGEGWDNVVFLVNDERVFRFVRREEGLEFSRNELIALPLLPADLPLKVPVLRDRGLYLGRWTWMSYALLRGRFGHEAELTDADRIASGPEIARFLARLHSQPVDKFRAAGLAGDWCGHMNLAKRVPLTREKLRKLLHAGLVRERAGDLKLVEQVEGLGASGEEAVVHGDFKASHLLFEDGRPVAVIDWGDIHIGHPAADLSIAYTFLPPEGRESFFASYGPVEESTRVLARFRALYHTLTIMDYAAATEQRSMLAESQRAYGWLGCA